MKVLFIVLDCLGDRPIAELGHFTPLQYARTPNIDKLASNSICGQMYSLGIGKRPSSDVAHMAMFGVDPQKYYTGRGPIELYGLGNKMEHSDIALRGNFALMNSDGIIIDRRAGRNLPPQKVLDELKVVEIDKVTFRLFSNIRHSFSLQLSGHNLSSAVSNQDPHIEGIPADLVKPLDERAESKQTAIVINKYVKYVNNILSSKYNVGLSMANCILLRSPGSKPCWFNFNEKYGFESSCCIVNSALENGIGAILGMKMINQKRYQYFNEYYDTIPMAVKESLIENDFVFLHIQEPDLYGEDGNYYGKVEVIEKIDNTLSFLNEVDFENTLVILTADHSTPCELKAHSGDSVPIAFCGKGVRKDKVKYFNEIDCALGSLGTILGKDIMPIILNLMGTSVLIGG